MMAASHALVQGSAMLLIDRAATLSRTAWNSQTAFATAAMYRILRQSELELQPIPKLTCLGSRWASSTSYLEAAVALPKGCLTTTLSTAHGCLQSNKSTGKSLIYGSATSATQ